MATNQSFDDIHRDATGFTPNQQQNQGQSQSPSGVMLESGTFGESLARTIPAIHWEKTDAMLYMSFFQVVLLLLMWRELRRA